jgi:hypothetical protein
MSWASDGEDRSAASVQWIPTPCDGVSAPGSDPREEVSTTSVKVFLDGWGFDVDTDADTERTCSSKTTLGWPAKVGGEERGTRRHMVGEREGELAAQCMGEHV